MADRPAAGHRSPCASRPRSTARWFDRLPAELRAAMEKALGPAARRSLVDRSASADGDIVLAALRAGNVVLLVQPPRGFGENPVAIYHDPELPPSHHFMAAYRWLRGGLRRARHRAHRQARQPGMAAGQEPGHVGRLRPDAALGNLPLIYPFLVNDPGEGTQAKRRAHATIVDHLVPPMTRAETYGDIARLEQLMDEHAAVAALDPAKLPAIRAQIWTLIQAAKLDHDLGLDRAPARRRVRRLPAARRRLAVRDQGRPDPRRPARARRGPRGRAAGRPGARDAAGPPDLGRRGRRRCPACARRSA